MMKRVLAFILMAGLGFLLAWALSDDTTQQKAQLQGLKTDLQQLTTAIGKTESERDTLKVRIALAEKKRDELREQVDELTESRDKMRRQVEEFSFSRDQSRQQLDEIIGVRDKLSKQLAELTASHEKLKQQFEELSISRDRLARQVDELTRSRDAAVADAQAAQKRIGKLVALLDGETEKFSRLQGEFIETYQAAQGTSGSVREFVEPPALHSFASNRMHIVPGQTSTLSWQVSNADRIRIEPDVGPVTASGSSIVKPIATTTYTLIAANKAGENRRTCRIEVGEAVTVQSPVIERPDVDTEVVEPVIVSSEDSETAVESDEVVEPVVSGSETGERPTCHSFNTTHPVIQPGQTAILSWQVSKADRIWIEPQVGTVSALGSRTVKPAAATTYTLVAVNKAGESRQSLKVDVGEPSAVQDKLIEHPAVNTELVEPTVVETKSAEPAVVDSKASALPGLDSFNVTRPAILPGQTSTLSWQVSNARKIRIEPEIGPVSALGSRAVKPSATTTYTLIATNQAGESKLSRKVEVSEHIKIFSSDSIDSRALLEQYKASDDSKLVPEPQTKTGETNATLGKFLGYRARTDESGKFIFIPVYENKQQEEKE